MFRRQILIAHFGNRLLVEIWSCALRRQILIAHFRDRLRVGGRALALRFGKRRLGLLFLQRSAVQLNVIARRGRLIGLLRIGQSWQTTAERQRGP